MILKDNKNKEKCRITGLFKFKIFILFPLEIQLVNYLILFKIEY